ncbi:hypothetical protein MASR2M50_12700 [Thauera sp.]
MHPAGLVQLAHRGIDDRVAGARLAPGGEELRRVVPLHRVVFGAEGAVDHLRVVPQDLVVEVAPDQLRQPGLGALAAARAGVGGELADRYGAEAQVGGQVADALHRGKVARALVALDARGKVVEQALAAAHADRHGELGEVGGFEADVGEAGQGLGGGLRRQVCGVLFHWIRAHLEVVDLLQPGVLVGREHAVGLARLGEHLVALEDHLVLEVLVADAGLGERLRHPAVAHDGVGLVVAGGEDLVDTELRRQARDLVLGAAVANDHPATGAARGARHGVERRIQLDQAGVDELDAAVVARRQGVEDRGIEDEGAMHTFGKAQAMVKRGVVEAAQVAAEPDEGGRHVICPGQRCAIMTHPPPPRVRDFRRFYVAPGTTFGVGAPAGANAATPMAQRVGHEAPASRLAPLLQHARDVETAYVRGRGAGVAGANVRSAEVVDVAGESRRRMSEERSDEFASPPPRRPPPRVVPSAAKGRGCRRRPPPRARGRIGAALAITRPEPSNHPPSEKIWRCRRSRARKPPRQEARRSA